MHPVLYFFSFLFCNKLSKRYANDQLEWSVHYITNAYYEWHQVKAEHCQLWPVWLRCRPHQKPPGSGWLAGAADGGGAPRFSSLPSSVDLMSLALTNPRWAVVPNLQDVAWLWGKRNWLATAPGETMIWNCPPTVNTQRWTLQPSLCTASCGSFERPLCTKYKRFKKERKWVLAGRIENSTDCCSASNISCLCVRIVLCETSTERW